MATVGYKNHAQPILSVDTDHYRRIEFLLVYVSIVICLLSGYELFVADDIARNAESTSGTTIATVENTLAEVRRKSNNLVAWSKIGEQDGIFAKDQIFTGSSSAAKIVFTNNTVINISENTLIYIESEAQDQILNLVRGSLHVNAKLADKIKVRAGSTTATLASNETKATISIADNGGLAIAVNEGNLNIDTSGTKIALADGQLAQLSSDGIVSKLATTELTLAKPEFGERFFLNPKNPNLEFYWHAKRSELTHLELSESPEFAKIAASTVTTSSAAELAIPHAGLWYWRVRSENNHSATGAFEARLEQPVTPVSPQDAATMTNQAEEQIVFDWIDTAPSLSYRLEIAASAEFTNTLRLVDNIRPPLRITGLKPGAYYWRVRSTDNRRPEAIWSQPNRFTINDPATPSKSTTPDALDPPELRPTYKIKIPKSGAHKQRRRSIWSYFYLIGTAYADDADGKIRWPAVKGATRYFVEISASKNFDSDVMSSEVNQPEIAITTLKSGVYFMRVAAIDASGRRGKTSTPSEIVIDTAEPNAQKTPTNPRAKVALTDKPRTAREIVTNAAIAAPTKTMQVDKSIAHVQLGFGPQYTRYVVSGDVPNTTFDITSANHSRLNAAYRPTASVAIEIGYARAVSFIMRDDESGKANGIEHEERYVYEQRQLVAHRSVPRTRWSLGAGLSGERFPFTYVADDVTLAVMSVNTWGPILLGRYQYNVNKLSTIGCHISVGSGIIAKGIHLKKSVQSNLRAEYQKRFSDNLPATLGVAWNTHINNNTMKHHGSTIEASQSTQQVSMQVGYAL